MQGSREQDRLELVERLLREVGRVRTAYHRLVLLVGPFGSGKSEALRQTADRSGGRLLNLNLEVSRGLLDVEVRRRALEFPQVLGRLVGRDESLVFLHHIEMIFDPAFELDPLRLLRELSRSRTVVAAWSGGIERKTHLTYANLGHPERQSHPVDDLVIVEMPRHATLAS